MPATSTSIRINPTIKKDAQELAKKLGANLSSIINIQLSQFVRDQRLNVSLRDENGFTPKASQRILDEMNDPENTIDGSFGSMDELVQYLKRISNPIHK